MGLRGLIKKKGDDDDDLFGSPANPALNPTSVVGRAPPPRPPPPPDDLTPAFTIIRSDTHTQEVVYPPDFADAQPHDAQHDASSDAPASRQRHSFGVFRRTASVSSQASSTRGDKGAAAADAPSSSSSSSIGRRRLSHRLHLGRTPSTSSHVPADLPEIVVPEEAEAEAGGSLGGSSVGVTSGVGSVSASGSAPAVATIVESQWEQRATILARENDKRSRPTTPLQQQQQQRQQQEMLQYGSPPGTALTTAAAIAAAPSPGSLSTRSNSTAAAVSSKELDATIQEAIRLHEEGELEQSTRLFGRLADPNGENNPLSQVLYGLALRHGWGCAPDTEQAVRYLSAAAASAAAVEEMALQAGLRKGGAAKGELVLAIFELANCFRHGWGLDKDPIAAKQYYETAANLGDTDAMNEVAWCYLEGFGCKKDKFLSAKYYRLAEQNGNKTLGNTWIWKEKYDPDKQKKKK